MAAGGGGESRGGQEGSQRCSHPEVMAVIAEHVRSRLLMAGG